MNSSPPASYNRDWLLINLMKHGMAGTPEHKAWHNMKSRCFRNGNAKYSRYGGRGVTVCERWKDSFIEFFKDVGLRPSSVHSLGRIDNDKGYFPGNVEWQTTIQQNNNKSNNRMITMNGRTMTLKNWSRETGRSKKSIARRFAYGNT